MEVHFNPDLEAKLDQLARETGREMGELVEDIMVGYFEELHQTRELLNSRYDDLKSGRVKPIDGEAFFADLCRREDELLKKHAPQCARHMALTFTRWQRKTSPNFGNLLRRITRSRLAVSERIY